MSRVVVIGGGIAGLWLLNLLTRRGYGAVLLEAGALGCQQTLASQGMIHGGLKYALSGMLTGASEAIAAMPDRWAANLAGRGEIDLSVGSTAALTGVVTSMLWTFAGVPLALASISKVTSMGIVAPRSMADEQT